jgi:hypothetical protein
LFVDPGVRSPEVAVDYTYHGVNLLQATWSDAASNRLLFQGGETFLHNMTAAEPQPEVKATDIAYIELSGNCNYNAAAAGISAGGYGYGDDYGQRNQRFSMSYITGSHAFKAGVITLEGQQNLQIVDVNQELFGVAFVTDPWGTGVELTEGLDAL